jgi:hypothetical protein
MKFEASMTTPCAVAVNTDTPSKMPKTTTITNIAVR